MAPIRRPRFWDRLFQNFPPRNRRETCALMCHTSGKMVGRRGIHDEGASQRRWLNWLAAALTAIGVVLLLSKLAWGEAPHRRVPVPVTTAGV